MGYSFPAGPPSLSAKAHSCVFQAPAGFPSPCRVFPHPSQPARQKSCPVEQRPSLPPPPPTPTPPPLNPCPPYPSDADSNAPHDLSIPSPCVGVMEKGSLEMGLGAFLNGREGVWRLHF